MHPEVGIIIMKDSSNRLTRKDFVGRAVALPALAGRTATTAVASAQAAKGSKSQFKYQDTPKDGKQCSGFHVLHRRQLGQRRRHVQNRRRLDQPQRLLHRLLPQIQLTRPHQKERRRHHLDAGAFRNCAEGPLTKRPRAPYGISNRPAAPMPPPTHIVTTTYLTPRRLPSISACIDHARAAHAVRVADRDRAAVDVEAVVRDPERVAAVDASAPRTLR